MSRNSFQKGVVEISTVAAMVIVAAVVAVVSIIATMKYYEIPTAPVAVITPKLTPKATPTPTLVNNETANWQTYINDKYGFEIKYPENYLAKTNAPFDLPSVKIAKKNAKIETLSETVFINSEEIKNYESLIRKKDKDITIAIYNNGNNYTLEQWLAKYTEINPVNAHLSFKEKDIIIDGVKGLKGGFGCCSAFQHSVFLKKDAEVYQIAGGFMKIPTEIYTNEEMFNQILSTFKFTK